MRTTFLFFIFLLLLLYSCTPEPPLSGKIAGAGNFKRTVYLIQPHGLEEVTFSYIGTVADSATVGKDGQFAFSQLPAASEPVLWQLAVQREGERFTNRLDNEHPDTDNYIPIVWQNGEVLRVNSSFEHFQRDFSLEKPSAQNEALLELRDIRKKAFADFLQEGGAGEHDPGELLAEERARLNYQEALMNFAEESDQLLPALLALRWAFPEGDFERSPEVLVSQCETWRKKAPDHPWVRELCRKAAPERLPLLLGAEMPGFSLPLLNGDTLPLHQLLGDSLTLVDLWASWCAPCRKENREVLVPLWDQYGERGFQIIGYALEGNADGWKKAIAKDGAGRWLHASHLQGDEAPFLDTLHLTTIPANYLLDAQGKVLARNLHGEALKAFVKDFLGEK